MAEATQEYFDNKKEQAEIALAISRAIPVGVKFYNLLIVFTEMTARYAAMAFKEEVYGLSEEDNLQK